MPTDREFVTYTGPAGGTFEVLAWGETSITLAVGSWTVEHNGKGLRAATTYEAAAAERVAPIVDRLRAASDPNHYRRPR
jgi:hypothetical protein